MITRITSMHGLGDNIYQRPHVKALADQGEVYIDTSWPEIYANIGGINFIKPSTNLRTQKKSYEKSQTRWVNDVESYDRHVKFGYGGNLRSTCIPDTMKAASGVANPPPMDLPNFGESPIKSTKPIAFVRPVTERREWHNSARNPRPEYIAEAIDILCRTHFIVSVADVEDGAEWLAGSDGGASYADVRFEKGELSIRQMLALFQNSDIIVGGMGWILPGAIAAKKKALIIGGGQLGHNHIDKVTAPYIDKSLIRYALPSNPCHCVDMRHNCDKAIDNFGSWVLKCLKSFK